MYRFEVMCQFLIFNYYISFIEFKVKLAYLKDNSIDVVDSNGILHEIFFMSSMNMKLKYGVSLEDLINMYKEKSK